MVSDMNNLYVISKENPIQLFDEDGPTEDGYDLTGIDDSLPLDLDDLDEKKRIEHRCHQRFQLKEDAFALVRPLSVGPLKIQGKSIGCIACAVFNAKPVKLGKIDNISMGGLTFQHVDSRIKLNNAFVLDILLADCGFYLANIPFKIITDFEIPDDIPGTSFEMRQVRLQFQNLNAIQQMRLKDFIFNHGAQISEIGLNE
jgi:hypothetical protein